MVKVQNTNLTSGSILKQLFRLALPIIGTSFVQTAYNLIDMFWIGFLGANAVAGVGIAGFFVWLSNGITLLSRTGTEIRVAQHSGANEDEEAKRYAKAGIVSVIVIALIYGIFVYGFNSPLVNFFQTNDLVVDRMSKDYLKVVSFGFLFAFFNQVMTGICNGRGNSSYPFRLNAFGLLINIILDPLMIFGIGPFPEMGVIGAALATVIAQGCISLLFVYQMKCRHLIFPDFQITKDIHFSYIKKILRLGLPTALQSILFTLISIVIARIIAKFGPLPIAAQKVGSQIESITWMTASGFSVAISAFVGQNFGAKAHQRVERGFVSAIKLATVLGIANSLLLYFGARFLFTAFIREVEVLPFGVDYLKILAFSQLFMFLEITMAGVFNGLGHTHPPAIVSIALNLVRIPLSIYLSEYTDLGINGIWWAITLSSIAKGIISFIWLLRDIKSTLYSE